MTLTWRDRIALKFLTSLMEANSMMIGEQVATGDENPARVGGGIAGRLLKHGLITYLPDMRAWRITAQGRDALKAAEAAE